ncbi:MAG: hypothetical protein JWN18_651, partial [Parcubacteria group bacterium]|nr:hypothetical protein [Parcubacteria group bacterium]
MRVDIRWITINYSSSLIIFATPTSPVSRARETWLRFTKRERPAAGQVFRRFVRVGRIELPSSDWQPDVLPLNHTRLLTI